MRKGKGQVRGGEMQEGAREEEMQGEVGEDRKPKGQRDGGSGRWGHK